MFEGYASVFNVVDAQGDMILPGAFSKTLNAFKENQKALPILWQHNPAEPIGIWKELRQTEKGLYVKGTLLTDISKGRDAHILIKNDVIKGLSIGYKPVEFSYKGHVRVLSSVDLYEISLVTFPANHLSLIT